MLPSPSNADKEEIQRKIIHVDMDCFYAAIEVRDDPALANQAVAVGGAPDRRGVICTANYLARQYGIRSAMATSVALRQCPHLIVLPVNMAKYRNVAQRVHAIFREYSDLVEPLALDEAYLDVTDSPHHQGSATWIGENIRKRIFESEHLTASAGIAPNKLLAKIASGWRKPNGLFVIKPSEIDTFIKTLAIDELYGVGKVTAEKLHHAGFKTCSDLQKVTLLELVNQYGKLGARLFEQCRGIDSRPVEPNRVRKSLSVEQTFLEDLQSMEKGLEAIFALYPKLIQRLQEHVPDCLIKSQFIKIKSTQFELTTAETSSTKLNQALFITLFRENYLKQPRSIRLLGLGVHFKSTTQHVETLQQELF